MDNGKIKQQLSDLLPDREGVIGLDESRDRDLSKEASAIKAKQQASELAKVKYREQSRLRKLDKESKERESLANSLGIEIPDGQTTFQSHAIAEQKAKIEAIETIEAQIVSPFDPVEIANNTCAPTTPTRSIYSSTTTKALQLQGASRQEITKLLTSLNINLNVQLSKQDTANLLATLLTCNESQLKALSSNKKIPIVIKIIIKRLTEDIKLGNIETVEKLWDRVFGSKPMQLELPEAQAMQTGILPNTPISREAYILIRDTLIK